jgi:hypothetical protein
MKKMTSSELIENGNMNEQWPLLAILCVLIGFTVYSWAQRQKIDGFRMLLRENKSEINRKEVHDAVEWEIENQTMSSRGWEDQVWKLEDAVGTTRKNLSDNVEGIGTGFNDLDKNAQKLGDIITASELEYAKTEECLGKMVGVTRLLKDGQSKADDTTDGIRYLESEVGTLRNTVIQLANNVNQIYKAVVDEEDEY